MIAFVIIISLVICATAFLWISRPKNQKTNYHKYEYISEGKKINIKEYEIFLVEADAMPNNQIKKGDTLLIKRLYTRDKYNIPDFPVILFNPEEDKFELRKFLCYIENDSNIDDWLNPLIKSYSDLFKHDADIKSEYQKALHQYKAAKSDFMILSSYQLDGKTNFSIYLVSALYGRGEYVIPKKKS